MIGFSVALFIVNPFFLKLENEKLEIINCIDLKYEEYSYSIARRITDPIS